MKVLTSSSLSFFRQCPRKYHYACNLKRVPVSDAAPLAFGKAMHTALEHWWKDGLEAAVEALKERAADIDEVDVVKMCALLRFYDPPRDRFEVLGVELQFEIKIPNPTSRRAFYGYRLAGKVDLLLREINTGHLYVVDHKTTASEILGFGTYWRALQVDGQMNNYCLAFGARGFIYDVLRKPGIRLSGKDEKAAEKLGITPLDAYQARCEEIIRAEPDAFYQWREHTKMESDIRQAREDLWQQVTMVRFCEKAGRYHRNSGECVGRYGTCAYLDVCTGRADIEDGAFFRDKLESHEELAA